MCKKEEGLQRNGRSQERRKKENEGEGEGLKK